MRSHSDRVLAVYDRVLDRVDGRTVDGKWLRQVRTDLERQVGLLVESYDRQVRTAETNVETANLRTETQKRRADTETTRRERAEQRLRECTEIKVGEDGPTVTVDAPLDPDHYYGTSHRWTVADLEETCLRLRIAGAGDRTPVTVERGKATANVAEPLPPSEADKAEQARRDEADREADRNLRRRNRRHTAATAAVWTVGIVVGAPVVLGVWWILTVVYGFMWGLVT